MSLRSRTSHRRSSRRGGSSSLSFFLGLFVAAGVCGAVYVKYKADQQPHDLVSIVAPSEVQGGAPPPAVVQPPGDDSSPSEDWIKEVIDHPGENAPHRIVRRPLSVRERPTPQAEEVTEEPRYPRIDDPPPTGKDELISATTYRRYVVREYPIAFRAEGGWHYLEIVFKSYRHEKWDVSREEWCSMQDSIWVKMRSGRKFTCKEMWDVLYPDENYRIVKMLFHVPDNSKPRELLLGKERWLIHRVENGGS